MAGWLTPTGVEGLDAVLAGGFPRGSLVVLAGCPGTGKTSFSAQFLYRGCVDYGESGVYVSFAESKETFYMNMRSMGCDFERLEKDGRFRFLELLTVKEEGIPYAAEMILKVVEEAGAKRLVIDSLSAMAQAFREPHEVRVLLHSILGKICRSLGCTALIITEASYENTVAYGAEGFVADGILLLKKNHLEGGRHLRLLEIVKMRGTPTPETQTVFTLKDGFKAFPPFKAKPIDKPQRFKPQHDTEQFFSTGSPDLDVMLGGGYPTGSTALIEIEEHISLLQYQLIVVPTLWNFLTQGRGVIVIPSAGLDHNRVTRTAELGGLTSKEINNLLKICIKGYPGIQLKPNNIAFKGEDISEEYKHYIEVEEELRRQTRQPILHVTGADMLIDIYGTRATLSTLIACTTRVRANEDLKIILLKPGYPRLAKILASMADVHLKITREHGLPLVYGVKPRTGFYAIEMDTSQGYAMPKLTQII